MPILLKSSAPAGEDVILPVPPDQQLQEFVSEVESKIGEIMAWVSLPSSRADIETAAASTPIRAVNPRFAFTPGFEGLDSGTMVHIAARALSELDRVVESFDKTSWVAGPKILNCTVRLGTTLAELNSSATDYALRSGVDRQAVKKIMRPLLADALKKKQFVACMLQLLKINGLVTVQPGPTKATSTPTKKAPRIIWTHNGFVMDWENFRRLVRELKKEWPGEVQKVGGR